jgi:hypothetical protein
LPRRPASHRLRLKMTSQSAEERCWLC